MWAKFASSLLKLLTVALASFLSYKAGKGEVKEDLKDKVIKDAELRVRVENEIAASYADPDKRKRLLDEWSE